MTGTRPELLNRRARDAVRDLMSGTVLREIDEMWQDELFAPPVDEIEPVGGQRVTHFQGYLNLVDWTDRAQVTRALRVFEVAIRHLFQRPDTDGWDPSEVIARLRRLFARDGYEIDDAGRISGGHRPILESHHLDNLTDPTAILEHLDRIAQASARNDPSQAIGSAKELVESTAKLVLSQRGEAFSDANDLPQLVRAAEEALHLHPQQATGTPDGSGGVRRILGAAISITSGIAELRNAYGTGHGRGGRVPGLGTRHANLAVNGARLWCQFMLDTLSDPAAPWRKLGA